MDHPASHLEASHYSHAVGRTAAHRKSPPKRSLDGAPSVVMGFLSGASFEVKGWATRRERLEWDLSV